LMTQLKAQPRIGSFSKVAFTLAVGCENNQSTRQTHKAHIRGWTKCISYDITVISWEPGCGSFSNVAFTLAVGCDKDNNT
jgi:hypothetical protein